MLGLIAHRYASLLARAAGVAVAAGAIVAGCSGEARPIHIGASQGELCTSDVQCADGSCVDGVCCDVACTDPCQVCSKALGATADGTCTTLAKCADGGAGTGGGSGDGGIGDAGEDGGG